ncbi:MAG: hypothetical protein ACRC35_00495 [Angustibacter sp.]
MSSAPFWVWLLLPVVVTVVVLVLAVARHSRRWARNTDAIADYARFSAAMVRVRGGPARGPNVRDPAADSTEDPAHRR